MVTLAVGARVPIQMQVARQQELVIVAVVQVLGNCSDILVVVGGVAVGVSILLQLLTGQRPPFMCGGAVG